MNDIISHGVLEEIKVQGSELVKRIMNEVIEMRGSPVQEKEYLGERTFVTQAELALDPKLNTGLETIVRDTFKKHNINLAVSVISEEGNKHIHPSTDVVITSDVVDGTFDYTKGGNDFGTQVAIILQQSGIVLFGTYYRMFGQNRGDKTKRTELYTGIREKGSYLRAIYANGRDSTERLRTSDCISTNNCTFVSNKHYRDTRIQRFLDELPSSFGHSEQIGSIGNRLCKIADGTCDALIVPPGKKSYVWDFAPGAVILQEAGGEITDGEGNRIPFNQLYQEKGVIASTGKGRLHEELVSHFKQFDWNKQSEEKKE